MMGMFYANLYIFKLSAQHSIWSIHICDVRVCLYAEDSVCVCVLWEGGEHLCVCVWGGGGGHKYYAIVYMFSVSMFWKCEVHCMHLMSLLNCFYVTVTLCQSPDVIAACL